MNTNRIQTNTGFASILNNIIHGAFALAIVGAAGVLTFSQFITFA